MKHGQLSALVLAVHPTSRGFGFVLFESPLSPYDWGAKAVRGVNKNRQVLRFVERTIDQYRPIAVVLEDWRPASAHRATRIRTLYRQIEEVARKKRVPVRIYPTKRVRVTFGHDGSSTRHDNAVEIAKRIPAFSYQLPPVRKAWMSEDIRQALYDAAALGLTYYDSAGATDR